MRGHPPSSSDTRLLTELDGARSSDMHGSAVIGLVLVFFISMSIGCFGKFQPSPDAGHDGDTDSSADVGVHDGDEEAEQTPDADGDSETAPDAPPDVVPPFDAPPDVVPPFDASPDADETPDADVCVPECTGLECGPDGCGGLCSPGCSPDGLCREGRCLPFQIVSVSFTSCAVLDGIAYCWGENSDGQIGDGTTTARVTPRAVLGMTDVEQIDTSGHHTCAVIAGGELWCWGENDEGQLGGGDGPDVHEPQLFEAFDDVRIVQCGSSFTCVIRSDGTVWCWGYGNGGRLGDGTGLDRHDPVQVIGVANAVGLRSANLRACAWTDEDRVYCWGDCSFSCIDGSGSSFLSPVEIPLLAGSGVRDIAFGTYHTCALTGDGEVLCWGRNLCGELGIGVYTYVGSEPETVLGLGPSVAISSDYTHTCAVDEDRRGFCWGENLMGQVLGSLEECVNLPLEMADLTELTGVVAGWQNSCAWTEHGELWCWGTNPYGVLGVGDSEDKTEPTLVDLP